MGEIGATWHAHSICGSTWGISNALRQHGFDAYPFEGFSNPDPFLSADIMFVSEWNVADYVEENGLWDYEKPAVLLLHSPYPGPRHNTGALASMYRGICFTRAESMALFMETTGDIIGTKLRQTWVAEWGFPDWWEFPPRKLSPYEPGTKNIVFAGRMGEGVHHRRIELVARAIPEAHVWVIANIPAEFGDGIEHDLRQIPNVHFLGRLPHGTFLNYLYYADVALDSGTAESLWTQGPLNDPRAEAWTHSFRRTVNNCKLWDYLAAGVPVVMDGAAGGDELLRESRLGMIVPLGDHKRYVDAVKHLLNTSDTPHMILVRRNTIRWMRENHTWGATVSRWADKFKAVTE